MTINALKDFSLERKVHSSISDIDANAWNTLVTDQHPFSQHAFLQALEDNQCLAPFGWQVCHLALYAQGQLVAAMPAYEKLNNYGEFVFDQAWEQAWNSIGLPYYPKLVSATPYTPARGPRFLVDSTQPQNIQDALKKQLFTDFMTLAQKHKMSGAHVLFAKPEQQNWLAKNFKQSCYVRHDCQFHWHNQNFTCFADFLATLKPKKRKNIKQERAAIKQANLTFRVLEGSQACATDWEDFAAFYQKTFLEKWSTPTLNVGFFKQVARTMPKQVVLIMASQEGKNIAGALCFRSDTHLYGRHWGAAQEIKHLHFETCFYQGIDYAIQQGLQVFEPGAGGEHKLARGFSPVPIESCHYLTLNPFVEGIERFVAEEKQAVNDYIEQARQRLPFR